jgi:predicted nuclease with TOPRIM domain
MQELYNALMRGETIYKDGVVIGQHAPSALAMRAARALKQLSDINDTNGTLINQLQSREQEWLKSMEITESKIEKLNAQLNKIIEKGYSIDEVIKNLEDLPPVVEEPKSTLEPEAEVVDKSTSATATATETQHNMFS